jgi:hypothetical protein
MSKSSNKIKNGKSSAVNEFRLIDSAGHTLGAGLCKLQGGKHNHNE